ncbi:hypothetical protein INR49_022812 [Caranx melampygus]|nr:hypothetical protein INR49_022812 [Caranx melampygus]
MNLPVYSGSATPNMQEAPPAPCCLVSLYSSPCPDHNLVADVLYDMILERIGRYVKHSRAPAVTAGPRPRPRPPLPAAVRLLNVHVVQPGRLRQPPVGRSSCSASSSNGSNHSGTCNEITGCMTVRRRPWTTR